MPQGVNEIVGEGEEGLLPVPFAGVWLCGHVATCRPGIPRLPYAAKCANEGLWLEPERRSKEQAGATISSPASPGHVDLGFSHQFDHRQAQHIWAGSTLHNPGG